LSLAGCASAQNRPNVPAASDPGRPTSAVATTGRVTLASFALAGRVAWRTLQTAGSAVGAFVTGGSAGADQEWKNGVRATRRVAREEARSVKTAAHTP
jgi:hypothetical protein